MMKRGDKKRWLDLVAIDFACHSDECLRFPFPLDGRGYGNFQTAGRKTIKAHAYVCKMAWGRRPDPKSEAAHSCGHRDCVNWRHLRWATRTENESDKLLHGTHNRGERQGRAKLKSEDVKFIRAALYGGAKGRALAAQYQVSEQIISSIKNGRHWAWL